MNAERQKITSKNVESVITSSMPFAANPQNLNHISPFIAHCLYNLLHGKACKKYACPSLELKVGCLIRP